MNSNTQTNNVGPILVHIVYQDKETGYVIGEDTVTKARLAKLLHEGKGRGLKDNKYVIEV